MAFDDRSPRPTRPLGEDLSVHVEAIVRAAEREARSAERAIAEQRRRAEEEVERYLAAARLRVDAEAAARAARLETLSSAARRLADQLADASAALHAELRAGEDDLDDAVPRAPWPAAEDDRPRRAPEPAAPQPTWARTSPPRAAAAPDGSPAAGAAFPGPPPEPAPAAPAATTAATEVPSAARLVAIEMAVGGAARAEVEAHLRAQFGVEDAGPLLDDVFGSESHAGSRLAWGEP